MARRLAAILAADVVGYSRLMGEDEAGTLDALKALRKDVVSPEIDRHKGRIVKLMGDGLLAEFASVVDAVECAIAIQIGMVQRYENVQEPRRIQLRIGINLGDIIVEGRDLYGDGVNVAARLEGLAEPGGICISAKVYEEVKTKVAGVFDDLGHKDVKNIAVPVQVYRWRTGVAETLSGPRTTNSSAGTLPLPDKASIAVLPFTNMSGDPEQDYFADGLVEEIITALSRLSWLFVIARNSSFIYKGRAVDVKEVGRDLGVRYVLEGSIRKAGSRLRITGQLIDAATGSHLWADRYDGLLEEIFDLQDQVTSSVVGAIAPKLELAEFERVKHKPTSSLDAYDCYLRGMAAFYKWTATDNAEALRHFYRAIEADPEYAIAYAMAARCFNVRGVTQPLKFTAEDAAEAERLARRAADLGRNDAVALGMAGVALAFAGRNVRAGAALTERALALNPNLASAWLGDGWVRTWLGQPEAAIEHLERAIELSPMDPTIFQFQSALSHAYMCAGKYDQAWSWAERALYDRPDHLPALLVAVVSAVQLGRETEAEEAKNRMLRLFPGLTQRFLAAHLIPYQRLEDVARVSEALRKAGFPE